MDYLTNIKAEFVELIGEPETTDIFSKALFYEKIPPRHPSQSLDSYMLRAPSMQPDKQSDTQGKG
jgi:hypothetical protein